jgi:hypothetical protein
VCEWSLCVSDVCFRVCECVFMGVFVCMCVTGVCGTGVYVSGVSV